MNDIQQLIHDAKALQHRVAAATETNGSTFYQQGGSDPIKGLYDPETCTLCVPYVLSIPYGQVLTSQDRRYIVAGKEVGETLTTFQLLPVPSTLCIFRAERRGYFGDHVRLISEYSGVPCSALSRSVTGKISVDLYSKYEVTPGAVVTVNGSYYRVKEISKPDGWVQTLTIEAYELEH